MLFFLTLLTLISNAQASPRQETALAATSGSSYQWAAIPEADFASFYSLIADREEGRAPAPATFGSPVAEWANLWIQSIDAKLRQAEPDRFRNIPTPKAFTTASASLNGEALTVPICARLRVQVIATSQEAGFLSGKFTLQSGGILGGASIEPNGSLCYSVPVEPAQESAVVEHFNSFDPRCRIVRAKGRWQISRANCRALSVEQNLIATQLQFNAKAAWIRINEGSVRALRAALGDERGEKAGVAMIAHELAHFYRAHGLYPQSYGFLYSEEQYGKSGKLKPAADDGRLRKLLDQTIKYENIATLEIPNSPFAPELNAWLANEFSARLGSFGGEECREWQAHAAAIATEPGRFVRVVPTCLDSLAVSESDDSPVQAAWLQDILEGRFALYSFPMGKDRPSNSSRPESLRDLLLRASSQVRALSSEHARLQAELRRLNLGQYTMEEEADNLSLDYLFHAGLPATATVDLFQALLELELAALDGNAPNFLERYGAELDDCRALTRESALPTWWPLGSLAAHHSACYRIFKTRRELALRPYLLLEAPSEEASDPWKRATLP